uniref:beta-microseminoprotein-like n=1 Tax=Scatophagus argus TaxID=75038 RepID=UPI001ED84C9C|nr:beta-microseminoprotein-like [Scatophagus argus]
MASWKYLALALLLCDPSPHSNASCFFRHMDPGITHCQDTMDKTWHAVGSMWRNSYCLDCSCSGCCQGYATPVGFPHDCVSVFDPEACEYIVHKRDDPSVICRTMGGVGK